MCNLWYIFKKTKGLYNSFVFIIGLEMCSRVVHHFSLFDSLMYFNLSFLESLGFLEFVGTTLRLSLRDFKIKVLIWNRRLYLVKRSRHLALEDMLVWCNLVESNFTLEFSLYAYDLHIYILMKFQSIQKWCTLQNWFSVIYLFMIL